MTRRGGQSRTGQIRCANDTAITSASAARTRGDPRPRSASVAASAPASARRPARASRARRPAPATTARASASKAVRCRCSVASRSAASRTRSAARSFADQRRRRSRRFDAGATVDDDALRARGLVPKQRRDASRSSATASSPRSSTVTAHAFSKTAQEKIEKAGGKVEARRGRSEAAAAADVRPSVGPRAMASGFANIGKVPELRRRILFTLGDARGLPHRRVRHDPRASTAT